MPGANMRHSDARGTGAHRSRDRDLFTFGEGILEAAIYQRTPQGLKRFFAVQLPGGSPQTYLCKLQLSRYYKD